MTIHTCFNENREERIDAAESPWESFFNTSNTVTEDFMCESINQHQDAHDAFKSEDSAIASTHQNTT